MSADPRAVLAEMQARLDKLDDVNSADIGLQMSVHYAVDTMLREDLPALVAALSNVLNMCDYWDTLAPGDQYYASRIRATITSALGGDRG